MIHHIQCDLLNATTDVIAHQVNCMGVMGSGVAAQIKEQFPEVYVRYRNVCRYSTPDVLLGMAQYVAVPVSSAKDRPLGIINLFAQKSYGRDGRHTDYAAFRESLRVMKNIMYHRGYQSVALPYKIGCVRGGGDWNRVLRIIEEELSDYEVFLCEKDMG